MEGGLTQHPRGGSTELTLPVTHSLSLRGVQHRDLHPQPSPPLQALNMQALTSPLPDPPCLSSLQAFNIEAFIPKLREYLRVQNPNKRQFLISWITVREGGRYALSVRAGGGGRYALTVRAGGSPRLSMPCLP